MRRHVSCCGSCGPTVATMLLVALVVVRPSEALRHEHIPVNSFIEIRLTNEEVVGTSHAANNPFDPAEIDLSAVFTMKGAGKTSRVLGFFHGGDDKPFHGGDDKPWAVRYTPTQAGNWTFSVSVIRNESSEEPTHVTSGAFHATLPQASSGYVRLDSANSRFFMLDDGTSYWPLGLDLCGYTYRSDDIQAHMASLFHQLADNGGNWARVWSADNVDDQTRYLLAVETGPHSGRYNMTNANNLDAVFESATALGIKVQLTINDQHSLRASKRWPLNFANAAKGGPISNPAEWFTNEKAQRMFFRRLRYLISRYSHHTSLMAFETFNELDFVDGYNSSVAARWHERVIAYLRVTDPYKHLITSSWALTKGDIIVDKQLDYLQTHHYDPFELSRDAPTGIALGDMASFLIGVQWRKASMLPQKPHFVGEFGIGPDAGKAERDTALHNGLWSSPVSGASGASSTWYWTYPGYVNYSFFKPLARVMAQWPISQCTWTQIQATPSVHGLVGFAAAGVPLSGTDVCKSQSLSQCDEWLATTHVWVWLRADNDTFSQVNQSRPSLLPAGNVTLSGALSLGLYTVIFVDTETGDRHTQPDAVQCYEGYCYVPTAPVKYDSVIQLILAGTEIS